MYNSNKILTTIKTKNGFVIKCKSCEWNSRMEKTHLCHAGQTSKGCDYYNKIISATKRNMNSIESICNFKVDEDEDEMVINKQERRGIIYKINRYPYIIEQEPQLLVKYQINQDYDGTYY